jgi:hypothetical protein
MYSECTGSLMQVSPNGIHERKCSLTAGPMEQRELFCNQPPLLAIEHHLHAACYVLNLIEINGHASSFINTLDGPRHAMNHWLIAAEEERSLRQHPVWSVINHPAAIGRMVQGGVSVLCFVRKVTLMAPNMPKVISQLPFHWPWYSEQCSCALGYLCYARVLM